MQMGPSRRGEPQLLVQQATSYSNPGLSQLVPSLKKGRGRCQACPTASDTGLQGVCPSDAAQLEDSRNDTAFLVTEFSKMVTSSW